MPSPLISSSGPLALGVHWSHDASAAICSPEGILCAIQEERLTRIKHHYGFPCQAIQKVLEFCGLTAADIDIVAFSSKSVFYPSHPRYFVVDSKGKLITRAQAQRTGNWRSWIKRNTVDEFGWQSVYTKLRSARVQWMIRDTWGEFAPRHYVAQEGFLRDLGLLDEKITHYYVEHHRSHASSAFRLSGLDEACIITIDGKGDGLSATIYRGYADGRMELLRSSKAEDSLGSFYQAITEALGFVPVDSEYKTMGLAALGHANQRQSPFQSVVRVEDGTFKSATPWAFRSYNEHNPTKQVPNPLSSVVQADEFKKLLDSFSREDFAYLAQEHCENNMVAYARDAMRITGCSSVVSAGGVMLNVKANSMIRDQLRPASYFVWPDASDSGLAIGAAMEALYQAGAIKHPASFSSPYLGNDFSEEEILDHLGKSARAQGVAVTDCSPAILANLLAQGKVVGTFQGRLEMGPRALGNRSVLADPRSVATKDRINLLLKGREFFVPFAPAVLREDAHLYWKGHKGHIDYRYMTFVVDATDYAKQVVPAVVHVDGTMRPQVVSSDSNPWLYEVLQEFKKLTGVGVLLNTSFNRHGLPIVGSPADALEHLANGWVDGISMGRWYVEFPLADAMARGEA